MEKGQQAADEAADEQDDGGRESQREGYGALLRIGLIDDRITHPGQDPDKAENRGPEGGEIEGEQPQAGRNRIICSPALACFSKVGWPVVAGA